MDYGQKKGFTTRSVHVLVSKKLLHALSPPELRGFSA